jgi:hypothetical protein
MNGLLLEYVSDAEMGEQVRIRLPLRMKRVVPGDAAWAHFEPPCSDPQGGSRTMAAPITPIHVGDVVRLKRPHPCGANEWEVTRLGMDIGLACLGCGRKVRLIRSEFDRRFRMFVRRGGSADPPSGA